MNLDNNSEYNEEIYPNEYNLQRELTPRSHISDIIPQSIISAKSNNSKVSDVVLNPNGFDVPIPLLSRIISETDVPLTSATSSVHFLLLGLCQAFELTPEEASIYISRNIDQLFDYIINGYNNNFQPVYKLFQIYIKYASKLGLILVDESHLIPQVFNLLSKSFYSQDERIIELGVDLISTVAKYAESQSNYSQLYEWLCVAYENNNNNNNPMIYRLIELYKTKHSLRNSIIRFLSSYCLPYVADITLDITPNYLDTMTDYIPFLHGILDIINIDVFSYDDLNQIYELCVSIRSTVDYQLLSFTLPYVYMELIRLLNGNDEESINLIDNCIAELKRLIRTPNPDLQIISLSCMFHLLDIFTKNNHCFAPSLYKTIIFTFLETRKQQFIHHYIISNLIELLTDSLSSVPIGILVEPLMKQNTHYQMDNYDLQLLYTLSSHPMLTAYHAGLILDPLKPLLFRDKIQSPICSLIYVIIILRFNDENIMNIVQDTVQMAIENIVHTIKNNRLISSNTIPFNLCVDYLATLLLSNNALIIENTANEIIPLQPLPVDIIDDIRKPIDNLFELIQIDSPPPENNEYFEENNNNNNMEEYNKLFAAPSLFEEEQNEQQLQEQQEQQQQEELMKQYAKEQLKDLQIDNPEDVVIYPDDEEDINNEEERKNKSFRKTPIPSKSLRQSQEDLLKQQLIDQQQQQQQQQIEQQQKIIEEQQRQLKEQQELLKKQQKQQKPLSSVLPNEDNDDEKGEEEEEEYEEENYNQYNNVIQPVEPPPPSYFPQERSKPPSQVRQAFRTPLPPPSSHENRPYNAPINEPLFSQPIDFLTTPQSDEIDAKPSVFPTNGNDVFIPPLRPPTKEQQQKQQQMEQQQRKLPLDKQTKPKSKIPMKKKSRFPPIKPNQQQEDYNENEEPIKFRSARNNIPPPSLSSKPSIPQLPDNNNNERNSKKNRKYYTPPVPELKENDNIPQADKEDQLVAGGEDEENNIIKKLRTQKKLMKTKPKTKKTVEENAETTKWKKQRQEAVDLARQTLKRAEDFKTKQQQQEKLTRAKTKAQKAAKVEEEKEKEEKVPPPPIEIKIAGISSEEIDRAKELLMPYKKSFYKLYIFFCKLKTTALGRDPIFSDLDKKTNTLNFAGWLTFLIKFDMIDYISKSDAKILFNKIIAKKKLQGLGFDDFLFCISSIATSSKWMGNTLQERVFHMLFHMETNVVVNQKGKAEKIRLNQWVNDSASFLKTIGYDAIDVMLKDNPDAVLLYGLKRDLNEQTQTIEVDRESFDNIISLSDNYVLFSKEKEKDDGELMNAIKTQTKYLNWNSYDDCTLLIQDMDIDAKSPFGKLYKKLEDFMKDEYSRIFKKRAAAIETSMENDELEKKEVKPNKPPIPTAVKKPKSKVNNKDKDLISPPKKIQLTKKPSVVKLNNAEDNRLAVEDAKLLKKAGINDPLSDRADAILTMFKENKNKLIKDEVDDDSESDNDESYIENLPEQPIESSVQQYSSVAPPLPTKTSPPKSIKSLHNSPNKPVETDAEILPTEIQLPPPSQSPSLSPVQQQQQQQQISKFEDNPTYDNLISPPKRKSKVLPPNPPPDIDLQSIDSTTTATASMNEKSMSVLSQRDDPPNRPPEVDSFFVPSEYDYDNNDNLNSSINHMSPVNQLHSSPVSKPKEESPKKEEVKIESPKTPLPAEQNETKPVEEEKPKEEELKPVEEEPKSVEVEEPKEEENKPQVDESKSNEEEKPKEEEKKNDDEQGDDEQGDDDEGGGEGGEEEEEKNEQNKPAAPKIPGKIPGKGAPKRALKFGKGKKGPPKIKPPH